MTLGIIGAMESEVTVLAGTMTNAKTSEIAGMRFYSGEIYRKPVVLVQSGIGKVCAGACAQILIDRFKADAIINIGVAGSLHKDLKIGDMVIADAAIQHDFDMSAFGYARGCLPVLSNNPKQPSWFPADPNLNERLLALAEPLSREEGFLVMTGTVVSGDVFIGEPEKKRTLTEWFDGLACEMEGAAVAQVAYMNGVPFTVVRAISDTADGGAEMEVNFEQMAADRGARLLLQFLKEN